MDAQQREQRKAELEAELAQLDREAHTQETGAQALNADAVEGNVEDKPTPPAATSPEFPAPGAGFDPTQQPPPDAAVGSEAQWKEPDADASTAPPVTAPTDPHGVATKAADELEEGAHVSQTTYAVVASDGSTATNTPDYADVPCPVCGNRTVKTTNVDAAQPVATITGESVNPGDQVALCESCGNTIQKGDGEAFARAALEGTYGDELKAAAEGGTPPDDADEPDDQEEGVEHGNG